MRGTKNGGGSSGTDMKLFICHGEKPENTDQYRRRFVLAPVTAVADYTMLNKKAQAEKQKHFTY